MQRTPGDHWAVVLNVMKRNIQVRGPRPEGVGRTVTGPSPTEGCFLTAGGVVSG